MLSYVREALIDAGAVSANSRLLQNVMMSFGDNISLQVYDPGRAWFHVKVTRYYDLADEFVAYRMARARFGERVAEPITHAHIGGWSILVARLVDHAKVRVRDLMAESPSNPLIPEMLEFFRIARATAPSDSSNDDFMRCALQYFADAADAQTKVIRHLEQTNSVPWAALPYIPQHGDFALNNLGRVGDKLFIFDWEDYGATGLAGFDICLMGLSLAGLNPATAERMLRAESPAAQPWPLTARACAVSGIDYAAFRASIPDYLIAFRFLKRNYGSAIRRRIDGILDHILS